MVFERLSTACKQDHLSVKHGQYANRIMQGDLTLQQYQHLLLANFWFHGQLEALLEAVLPETWQQSLQLAERKKLPYIIKDLEGLGFVATEFPAAPVSFQIQDPVEALGVMYVTEGTAIGGAIIRKNLLKIPELDTPNGFHFYGCYGKALSERWKSFAKVINQVEGNMVLEEIVIEKAKETFMLYETLLQEAEGTLADCIPVI